MRALMQFRKSEQVRHLGHLDLQRTFQRALRRSGLPLAYSKGFHPHVLVAFASALSVGVSSDAEIVDVTLAEPVDADTCLTRANAVLPDALRACRAVMVEDTHPGLMGLLKQADYDVLLIGADSNAFAKAAEDFLAQEDVQAVRKSKRGEKLVNIRPMVHALSIMADAQGACAKMRVSLEEAATLKPELLIQTLATAIGADMPPLRMHRTALFGVRDGQAVPLIELS